MLEHSGEFPVVKMAKVLNVSPEGFRKWKNRNSVRNQVKDQVCSQIRMVYIEHKGRLGAPMIHSYLTDYGLTIGRRTIGRYMHKMGLKSVYRRKFKKTTDSNHDLRIAPNRVQRNFRTNQPNQVWVTDITYLKTVFGWLYFCVFLDLYNRKVVGWSIGRDMKTGLVLRAYHNAVRTERPAKGLIVHSDRGSQYASNEFRRAMIGNRHLRSMSRKGDCWDNAVAESYFKTLKMELIYQNILTSLKQCNNLLFEYIEVYYNRKRKHSTLGYLSPEQFTNRKMKAA